MKSPTKDLVLIAVALFAILGCGFGLGNAFAPRAVEIDPSPIEVELTEFKDLTLSKLSEMLELTPEQEKAILGDIEDTDGQMRKTRKRALLEAYLHIRELHDKIGPKLDPKQQETLKKSRDSLQKVIELRFPRLLGTVESATGGGSKTCD